MFDGYDDDDEWGVGDWVYYAFMIVSGLGLVGGVLYNLFWG